MELADLIKKSAPLAKFQVGAFNKVNPADKAAAQRDRFTQAVQLQLDALECEQTNKPFVHKGIRKVQETGEVVEKVLRFRKWWRKDGNRYIVTLRYGASPLFKDSVVAPTLDDVLTILDGIIDVA